MVSRGLFVALCLTACGGTSNAPSPTISASPLRVDCPDGQSFACDPRPDTNGHAVWQCKGPDTVKIGLICQSAEETPIPVRILDLTAPPLHFTLWRIRPPTVYFLALPVSTDNVRVRLDW